MNETDTYNETILEAQEGDFYTFLEAEDWKNAQAITDNLWDLGKDAKAEELRRVYLRAQTEVSTRKFAPQDNPLNGVKVEGHFGGMEDRYPFTAYSLNTVRVQMNLINKALYGVEPFKEEEESELDPNRGNAPF